MWVRISIRVGCTTLCDKVSLTCVRLLVFSWSSTNKTDRHNITEILLKVALSTNKQTKHKNAHNWLYFSVEHSSLWTFVNSSFCCTQKAAGLQLRFITIRLTYRYLVKSLAGKTDEFFLYFVLIYFFWKVNILYVWSKMFILELNYCFVVGSMIDILLMMQKLIW